MDAAADGTGDDLTKLRAAVACLCVFFTAFCMILFFTDESLNLWLLARVESIKR